MAKKVIDIREQVLLEPKEDDNKVYVYLFLDKKLWRKFFTHPPYKHSMKINLQYPVKKS